MKKIKLYDFRQLMFSTSIIKGIVIPEKEFSSEYKSLLNTIKREMCKEKGLSTRENSLNAEVGSLPVRTEFTSFEVIEAYQKLVALLESVMETIIE